MRPVDIRNATFDELRGALGELREAVLRALEAHGPCTTRRLAEASGIDLLTVRPRVTELVQMGAAELAGAERRREGVYRARTDLEWALWFEGAQERARAGGEQLLLGIQ
jgi:predicted ArsR family transcriptional regulator